MSNFTRITIGNSVVSGFVNHIDGNRLIIGTGSYQTKDGQRVFKESLTVFMHEAFDGQVPAKGDYVKVSGDLVVSPRKDTDQLNVTFNVRFANQLVKTEAPQRASSEANAQPALADEDDI